MVIAALAQLYTAEKLGMADAPKNTTIACWFQNAEITSLKFIPEARTEDVIILKMKISNTKGGLHEIL